MNVPATLDWRVRVKTCVVALTLLILPFSKAIGPQKEQQEDLAVNSNRIKGQLRQGRRLGSADIATGEEVQSNELQQDDLKHCSFEIVTVDTRANEDLKNGNITHDDIVDFIQNPLHFRTVAALANQAYAERYGHTYSKVEPRETLQYGDAWNKFFYLQERLQELNDTHECIWLVSLDFDAFFHQPDVSLVDFMTHLAHKYHIQKDQSLVIAAQGGPDVNTGAFFVRADDNGRLVMNEPINLFNSLPNTADSLRHEWPLDQGALNSLLLSEEQRHEKGQVRDVAPDSYINQLGQDVERVRKTTVKIDLEEINSHHGRFIEHVWGGSRGEPNSLDLQFDHRFDPGKAVLAEHLDPPERFAHLMRNLKKNTLPDWHPRLVSSLSGSNDAEKTDAELASILKGVVQRLDQRIKR